MDIAGVRSRVRTRTHGSVGRRGVRPSDPIDILPGIQSNAVIHNVGGEIKLNGNSGQANLCCSGKDIVPEFGKPGWLTEQRRCDCQVFCVAGGCTAIP